MAWAAGRLANAERGQTVLRSTTLVAFSIGVLACGSSSSTKDAGGSGAEPDVLADAIEQDVDSPEDVVTGGDIGDTTTGLDVGEDATTGDDVWQDATTTGVDDVWSEDVTTDGGDVFLDATTANDVPDVEETTGDEGGGDEGGDDDAGDTGTTTAGAPLCGPDAPCVLHENVKIDDPHFRNNAPDVAVGDGPMVLYSIAEGGYHGYVAEPGDGGWVSEKVPTPVAFGGIVWDHTSSEVAIVTDDGAFGVSHWRRAKGVWSQSEELAGADHGAWPDSLFVGSDGTMHAGVYTTSKAPGWGTWDGAWTYQSPAGPDTSWGPVVALALDDDEQGHLLYYESSAGNWKLTWTGPGGETETVDTLTASLGSVEQEISVRVTGKGKAAQVHALYATADFQGSTELHYAHRGASGGWNTGVIDSVDGGETCSGMAVDGATCSHDYWTLRPLGVVRSGNQVRFFYARTHVTGSALGKCETFGGGGPPPPPECFWEVKELHYAAQLRVAWPSGAAAETTSALVSDAVHPVTASFEVEANGDIHVGSYTFHADGTEVRYLRIGE